MNDSLILIGFDDLGSNYAFRVTRGFLNTEAGIVEARQYVNMLIEAKPYETLPVAMVVPLGLMGDAPDGLTRDKAVQFAKLFPLPTPLDDDEALATLRAKLTGNDTDYRCAGNGGGESCVGPLHLDQDSGAFVCTRHEPIPNCADNTGKGDCALPMRRDIDGEFRCSMHRSEPEPFNDGLIPGREDGPFSADD